MQLYILNDGVEVYPSGDGLVAVHTVNDEIHRLNATAGQILEACNGVSLERISDHVRDSHPDVPARQIDEDVEQALSVLLSKGLIRTVNGSDETATPDTA